MHTAALIEKIGALARDEREAVERFVARGQAGALECRQTFTTDCA